MAGAATGNGLRQARFISHPVPRSVAFLSTWSNGVAGTLTSLVDVGLAVEDARIRRLGVLDACTFETAFCLVRNVRPVGSEAQDEASRAIRTRLRSTPQR